MHGESPAVQHLPIHLPNEHYVNFHAHQTVNEVLARQNVEKTQLTAWFDYNSAYNDGLGLTYWQFPQHYTWKDILCVTIKERAVLLMTSFDYI